MAEDDSNVILIANKGGGVAGVHRVGTKEEPPKEKPVSEMSFSEVHSAITNPDNDWNALSEHRRRRTDLYRQAENTGVFDGIGTILEGVARNFDWDEVTPRLTQEGNRLEEVSQKSVPAYRDRPDLHGIVEAAVDGVALATSLEGYEGGNPSSVDWLAKKGMTSAGLVRLKDRVIRNNFIELPNGSIADRVGEDLKSEPLPDDSSQGNPDATRDDELTNAIARLAQVNEDLKRELRDQNTLKMRELQGLDEGEQLDIVRDVLDLIENGRLDWASDRELQTYVVRLQSSYDLMEPNVRKEVQARLSIHTTGLLMDRANGFITNPEARRDITISDAVATAKARGLLVDDETIRFSLKENFHGLGVSEAWDWLEVINSPSEYKEQLDNMGIDYDRDNPPENYFTDSNEDRKQRVMEAVLWTMMDLPDDYTNDEYDDALRWAEKAVQIADKLASATCQKSKWNVNVAIGNDQLAESIYFQKWRENRDRARRNKGSDIHYGQITSLANTWLGSKTGKDVGLENPLTSELINPSKLSGGSSLEAWATTTLVRGKLIHQLFTDTGIKAGQVNEAFLAGNMVLFNDANKVRSADLVANEPLEPWFIAQVVNMWLYDVGLGADKAAFEKLKQACLKNYSIQAGDVGRPFITEAQWNWVMKANDYGKRFYELERAKAKADQAARRFKY